ncbi:hypothetical protein BU17DRAFT_85413 [Hysterangium stoloniferum]|nr:hypothetical protein BU17DRAFT_85413 [Hysterangium stoloniferum]
MAMIIYSSFSLSPIPVLFVTSVLSRLLPCLAALPTSPPPPPSPPPSRSSSESVEGSGGMNTAIVGWTPSLSLSLRLTTGKVVTATVPLPPRSIDELEPDSDPDPGSGSYQKCAPVDRHLPILSLPPEDRRFVFGGDGIRRLVHVHARVRPLARPLSGVREGERDLARKVNVAPCGGGVTGLGDDENERGRGAGETAKGTVRAIANGDIDLGLGVTDDGDRCTRAPEWLATGSGDVIPRSGRGRGRDSDRGLDRSITDLRLDISLGGLDIDISLAGLDIDISLAGLDLDLVTSLSNLALDSSLLPLLSPRSPAPPLSPSSSPSKSLAPQPTPL